MPLEGLDSWELGAWIERLGSMPVQVVARVDNSGCYEMERATVLRLENGKYAVVAESGCSCYETSEAEIDHHPDEESARRAMKAWLRRYNAQANVVE